MRQHARAAARNREPIAQILAEELPENGTVLEVASGTGVHALYFAERFSGLDWQPTDADEAARASISAWRKDSALTNLLEPLALDAASDAAAWPVKSAAAGVCINMIHISPWASAQGLFAGMAAVLPQGGKLILYGPYREDGVPLAPSNLAFDQSLKRRNPQWGLRDLAAVDRLAEDHGFTRTRRAEMPANNLLIVYCKG